MSITKRKNGNWEVRFRAKSGKHISKTFKLKSEAREFERDQLQAMRKGTWTDPALGKTTIGELFERFFATKLELKPKSREAILSVWRSHLEPHFADIRVAALESGDILDWATKAVTGPDAYATTGRILKAQQLLSQILDFAVDLNLISRNPARKSNGKLNTIQTKKTDRTRPAIALTRDELLALAKHCGQYETLILLGGVCGLRWAELVGLQVGDLNQESGILTISRTISEVSGKFFNGATKNGQTRTLVVPDFLLRKLREVLAGREQSELMFPNRVGRPLSSGNFRQRVFDPAVKKSGVLQVTIHDLRHTAASIAVASGANVRALSHMLGHSDVSLTLNRYSHLFMDDLHALSNSIDGAFGEATFSK